MTTAMNIFHLWPWLQTEQYYYYQKEDTEAEDQGLDIQDIQYIFIGEQDETSSYSAWQQAASPTHTNQIDTPPDQDEYGPYIELCFADHMGPTIMDEKQREEATAEDIATLRIYVTEANKRAVVVKEDDLLAKQEMQTHAP